MDAIIVMASGPLEELMPLLAERLRYLNPDKLVVEAGPSSLPSLSNFALAKAWQWDLVPREVDRLLYLDSDTFPVVPFPEFPETDFAAVMDKPSVRNVETPFLLRNGVTPEDCERYFNSGVMLSSRRARPMFDEVKAHASEELARTRDQSWLNVLAPRHGFSDRLPCEWNYFVRPEGMPDGVIVLHYAGIGNARRIPELKRLFEESRRLEEGNKKFT